MIALYFVFDDSDIWDSLLIFCVCVCVRACVCVRVCVRACVRVVSADASSCIFVTFKCVTVFWKFICGSSFRPRLKVGSSREFVCCCLISWGSHQPGNSLKHIFVSRFTRPPGTVSLDCRSRVRARSWWQMFRGDCFPHEVTRLEKSDLLAVPWRQPYCLFCGDTVQISWGAPFPRYSIAIIQKIFIMMLKSEMTVGWGTQTPGGGVWCTGVLTSD